MSHTNSLFLAQIFQMENGWKNIPQTVEGETNKKAERSSKVRNQQDERIEVELFFYL